MSDFDTAFVHVVALEGGYVNDPCDPGGRTIYGITERDHPEAWAHGTPSLDTAKAIYRRDYWNPVQADELPFPLNVFVFDAAINQGPDAAIRMLQKTLGVRVDGKIGRVTLAAAKSQGNNAEILALYMADRALRYTGTRNFDRFGRGWLKRLFRLAMSLA